VFDAIYAISQAWSSFYQVALVHSWMILLPVAEENNFHGFSTEEISKSEIRDILCAMRSFENIRDKVGDWLQFDVCEVAFGTRQTLQCCCKSVV
jgi:hypothetical protein